MFVHGVSNATSSFIPMLEIETINDHWFSFKAWAVMVTMLIPFPR